MPPFDVASHPTWLNLAIFAVAAAVVWLVGTRPSAYAELIAERTGLGRAFIGLVLPAGIALTGIYLLGLIERRDRVVLRMGLDSAAVLGLFGGTLLVLYSLR